MSKKTKKATQYRAFFGEPKDLNEEERSFSHRISDESVDAHGSIIKGKGWDLDRMNKGGIPVLFAHSHSQQIGRSVELFQKNYQKELWSRSVFAGLEQNNELAETMWLMAKDGFMKNWSVGFNPVDWELREDITEEERWKLFDPYVYTKQELLEYSLVPVPSNPNAITQARDAGIDIVPLMDRIGSNKCLIDNLTLGGFELPTINDSVRGANPPAEPEEREPVDNDADSEPESIETPLRIAAQKKIDQVYGPGHNNEEESA